MEKQKEKEKEKQDCKYGKLKNTTTTSYFFLVNFSEPMNTLGKWSSSQKLS